MNTRFDAWLRNYEFEYELGSYDVLHCGRAYAAGHAAASECVAELERELKARTETDRELIKSLERSSQNLNEYATERASWDLPMSGPDLGTRDVIKQLREEHDMTSFAKQLIPALRKHADTHRLVCTGSLTAMQIALLDAAGLLFVDEETALGFALVPWEWVTRPDAQRQITVEGETK